MGQIKILEDRLADKIAAGEVVERPLSVVKELLENSLDAGADFVEIDIQDGGISRIRVKDNGRGMDAEDLRLAFERHATSKIADFQDLYKLTTFGFRGEALPSIAAVAQVEMTTGLSTEPEGHTIRIDGGAIGNVESCPPAGGTVMEVKNLFFNVPARRKFLKSASYEGGLIGDLISKYALGHPEIRFRFIANGKLQMDTAGYDSVEKRLAYLYGNNLEPLIVHLPVSDCGNGKTLTAWLVREEITRNNRSQEIFFVNGRLVKSAELSGALEEGYYTMIPKGRFPVAVLLLNLPGDELDVNVHPAKTEVKIHRFDLLRPQIVEYLKDSLWQANITKNAYLPESIAPGAYRPKPVNAAAGTGAFQPGEIVAEPEKLYRMEPEKRSMPAESVRPDRQQNLFDEKPLKASETPVKDRETSGQGSALNKAREAVTAHSADAAQDVQQAPVSDKPVSGEPILPQAHVQPTKRVDVPKKEETIVVSAAEKTADTSLKKGTDKPAQPKAAVTVKNIGNLTLIGQLNNSFILAQNEEGLYIIDQHTCHERILYERFMEEEREKQIVAQPLLIPATVNLSVQQETVLMQHIFTLRDLGLELENFGDRSYLIRSLPLGLHDMTDVEGFFVDLLNDLEQQKTVTTADIKEKLLITASCKGAVKAQWPLTDVEMLTLLHDLSRVENAHTCPHGRPIIYKITMSELYKIFKRGTYHD